LVVVVITTAIEVSVIAIAIRKTVLLIVAAAIELLKGVTLAIEFIVFHIISIAVTLAIVLEYAVMQLIEALP
jgi:hypothetical protein